MLEVPFGSAVAAGLPALQSPALLAGPRELSYSTLRAAVPQVCSAAAREVSSGPLAVSGRAIC